MDTTVILIFALVYLGMMAGRYPGLALDRTGIALLGAIALVVFERVTTAEAWAAIDVPTMMLLLGLMIVSAQLRLGGFYAWTTRKFAAMPCGPRAFLALVILTAGVLSALLANDIICLAMAPILIECCAHRGEKPLPSLLGLACAANVGSAATLIGNPQNMLIGQSLSLSFTGYLEAAFVPSALGLAAAWAIIVLLQRGDWTTDPAPLHVDAPPFGIAQTAKGLAVLAAILIGFLFAPWPREVTALGGAALLLMSRTTHTRAFIGLVDWHLLMLFAGLFVVNHALEACGAVADALAALAARGVNLEDPAWLFTCSIVLSNLVSNVPAAMLLLPAATHPLAGPVLALSSTLAGNLFIVGSIANIIVVDQAARYGVKISWRDHVRVGAPVTAATLAIAAAWLWCIA